MGTIKVVGRIHRQTFIDTYSRVAQVKLYTDKSAITAADLLDDCVVPFFDEWVTGYKESRQHSGRYCFGKTPWQTFLDSNPIRQQKNLSR